MKSCNSELHALSDHQTKYYIIISTEGDWLFPGHFTVTTFRILLTTAENCGVSAAPNKVVSTAHPFIMFLGKNSAVWWQGVAKTLLRVCHIKLLPNYIVL